MCTNLLGGLSAPKLAWAACPVGACGGTREHGAGTHRQELTAHAFMQAVVEGEEGLSIIICGTWGYSGGYPVPVEAGRAT